MSYRFPKCWISNRSKKLSPQPSRQIPVIHHSIKLAGGSNDWPKSIHIGTYEGFHKWGFSLTNHPAIGVPRLGPMAMETQNHWKIPLKWMIYGYPMTMENLQIIGKSR